MRQSDSRLLYVPTTMAYGGHSDERKHLEFAVRAFPQSWAHVASMPHKRFKAAWNRQCRANGEDAQS